MRTLAALLLTCFAAFAQPECAASGVVVNSVTGEMIARAVVSAGKTALATTDANGQWSTGHLPCGKLAVAASHPTFLPGRSIPLEVAAGTPLLDLRLELIPQATITGRVVDEFGDPIPDTAVTLKRFIILDGVRQYLPGPRASSNDIGEYRIPQVAAGQYLICARDQCSIPMTIRAGYNGVMDFRLSPVVKRQLRGKVTGAPEGAQVQLTLTSESTTLAGAVGKDGEFEISAPPGSYTILASAFTDSDQLTARTPIEVSDHDVDDISVPLDRPFEIGGTVRILSEQGTQPDTSKVEAFLYQQPQDIRHAPSLHWDDDRMAFTVTNLLTGRYHLYVSAPPGIHVERVTAAGADITDSEFLITPGFPPIEIVLSDNGGTLEGTTEPDSGIIVIRGNRHWILLADKEGKFRADGFPAGDYRVSAWDDLLKVPFRDEAWMELHAKAVSVTLGESQSASATLERSIAPDE
jgi:hypothetical protein